MFPGFTWEAVVSLASCSLYVSGFSFIAWQPFSSIASSALVNTCIPHAMATLEDLFIRILPHLCLFLREMQNCTLPFPMSVGWAPTQSVSTDIIVTEMVGRVPHGRGELWTPSCQYIYTFPGRITEVRYNERVVRQDVFRIVIFWVLQVFTITGKSTIVVQAEIITWLEGLGTVHMMEFSVRKFECLSTADFCHGFVRQIWLRISPIQWG